MVAISGGSAHALVEVYDRHGFTLYDVARRLCGGPAAEDLTLEALLCLWLDPAPYLSDARGLLARLVATVEESAVVVARAAHRAERQE